MNYIINFINEYGTIAIFLIILLEYACFPVSSEIVLPLSGAVASINHTHFLVILPLSILAGMIGTGLCYSIGWYGGGAILHLITHKFPKTKKGIDIANEKFKRNGASAVCIGRVIPLIRTYIALIAGAARLNPATYFCASLLGITIWNTILIGLGFIMQENYSHAARYYERYKHNLIPVTVIFLLLLALRFFLKKRSKKAHVNSL